MTEAKTIDAKIVEAWCGIENPNLDCVNPHFKNKYASLKETQRVIRDACRPQGLMYQQKLLQCEDGQYRLYSYVKDAEGNAVELSTFPVENVPNSQAFGSELTYKKRQQAQADWGIVGEEDDDGEAVTGHQSDNAARNTYKPKTTSRTPNGAVSRQSTSRYDALKGLKAQALALGITEDGMQGALQNVLKGKPMKDATDEEIKACEGVIQTLVNDKEELNKEAGNVSE